MMIDAILWLKSHGMMKIELGVADGLMDRRTDRRTDKPAYRDARTYLKRGEIDGRDKRVKRTKLMNHTSVLGT